MFRRWRQTVCNLLQKRLVLFTYEHMWTGQITHFPHSWKHFTGNSTSDHVQVRCESYVKHDFLYGKWYLTNKNWRRSDNNQSTSLAFPVFASMCLMPCSQIPKYEVFPHEQRGTTSGGKLNSPCDNKFHHHSRPDSLWRIYSSTLDDEYGLAFVNADNYFQWSCMLTKTTTKIQFEHVIRCVKMADRGCKRLQSSNSANPLNEWSSSLFWVKAEWNRERPDAGTIHSLQTMFGFFIPASLPYFKNYWRHYNHHGWALLKDMFSYHPVGDTTMLPG